MQLPHVSIPTVAIQDTADRFPVRRIFCVGQNYAAHVREMGGDPQRQPPFFFNKPADAIIESGRSLPFPSLTENLHHEVELVVALGGGGENVAADQAERLIFGYAVGIDLTRRDLQSAAKKQGRPWDMAKGFDRSAPIGAIARYAPAADAGITLSVNGETRQQGKLSDMIWNVPEILSALSAYVALQPGDLIFTGTPSGVGPIVRGDKVYGAVENLPPIEIILGD
jgi:fumarylpyruvate hydrolase